MLIIKIFDCDLHDDCAFKNLERAVEPEVIALNIYGGFDFDDNTMPAHHLIERKING